VINDEEDMDKGKRNNKEEIKAMEGIKTDCVQQCREEENQKEEKVHRI